VHFLELVQAREFLRAGDQFFFGARLDEQREVLAFDLVVVAQQDCALEDVFQLDRKSVV